jgi:hypothetical protein
VVTDLARVTAVYNTLRRYKSPTRRLQVFARERSILDELLMDDLSRVLEGTPPERRADEVLRLLEDKKEKLDTFLKILREKAATLADQPAILAKGEKGQLPRGSPTLLQV